MKLSTLYNSGILLFMLCLTACSATAVHEAITNEIYNSAEHRSFITYPRSVIGKYYSMKSDAPILGSVTFDDAIEIQTLDKLRGDEGKQITRNISKMNDLKSKSIWLNRGMNKENKKADLLLKVIDSKVRGDRSAAVRILAINKFYAGSKWWMGSENFIRYGNEISCPVANPDSLDPDASTAKASGKQKRLAGQRS